MIKGEPYDEFWHTLCAAKGEPYTHEEWSGHVRRLRNALADAESRCLASGGRNEACRPARFASVEERES